MRGRGAGVEGGTGGDVGAGNKIEKSKGKLSVVCPN